MGNLYEQIKRHIAGAGFMHKTPFADLSSYKNEKNLPLEFSNTWCVPFYMMIGKTDEAWMNQLIQVSDKINKEIVLTLLGDFDWRTRQTGAFFAAIKGFEDLTDIIGTHFLKSELTYAGQVYAYTFASFNSPEAVDYLERYLSYYLLKPDLWFDQREALEALTYLDKINQTMLAAKHQESWLSFIKNKPYWKKEINLERIEAQMKLIENVKNSGLKKEKTNSELTKRAQYGLSFQYWVSPDTQKRKPECKSAEINLFSHLALLLTLLDRDDVEDLLSESNKAVSGHYIDEYPCSDSYSFVEIRLHYPEVTIDGRLTIPMTDFITLLEEWDSFLKQ